MTTTEKNKLIAEFLHGKNAIHPNQYHYNWNELMPVVEKIESFNNGNTSFIIEDERSFIDSRNGFTINSVGHTKIEAVYNACIEFILWYNQNLNN